MLIRFFLHLKHYGVSVSIREWLDLLAILDAGLIYADADHFYRLAKVTLVKDERYFDKFDRAFSVFFEGFDEIDDLFKYLIPDDWLKKELERHLTDEEKNAIESQGGLNALIKKFKERLEEQHARHQGGNKWIGTGGTSPFGAFGFNPAGFRIGGESRHRRALKVWEQRRFKDLDDSVELGTRNLKMAMRKLRRYAREGAHDELDMPATIRSTAEHAGLLDVKMRPERRNTVKLLIFFDVGGSMDDHVRICEDVFSAAKSEFKHMKWFYFHNAIYDQVWTNNARRRQDLHATWDLIHTYPKDYHVIFVGDAAMAPYELSSPGGSLEGWNQESGDVWLRRLAQHFEKSIWLNPVPKDRWAYTWTTLAIAKLMNDRMFELSLVGLEQGIKVLSR